VKKDGKTLGTEVRSGTTAREYNPRLITEAGGDDNCVGLCGGILLCNSLIYQAQNKFQYINRNNNMNRNIFYIVMAACILFVYSPCHGADSGQGRGLIKEVKVGILSHDVDGLWSGFKREKGLDVNCAAIFGGTGKIFGGNIHPVLGASLNTQGYTSRLYLDGIWHYDLTQSIFGSFGLGVALHNGERHLVSSDRKALGSQILFHLPIEVGYRFDSNFSLSIYFDHMSNAELSEENEGLDTLGIRVGYTF